MNKLKLFLSVMSVLFFSLNAYAENEQNLERVKRETTHLLMKYNNGTARHEVPKNGVYRYYIDTTMNLVLCMENLITKMVSETDCKNNTMNPVLWKVKQTGKMTSLMGLQNFIMKTENWKSKQII